MTWPMPNCCTCDHRMTTNYGPLGPMNCRLTPGKGEIGVYNDVSPIDGLPLVPWVTEPRPGWCPRMKEKNG